MSLEYVNSSKIVVFPSVGRTYAGDTAAHLMTEKNASQITRSLYKRNSFVLSMQKASGNAEFVLGGYYFKLSDVALIKNNNDVYASIYTADAANDAVFKYQYLQNISDHSISELDNTSDNKFYGLLLHTSESEIPADATYTLQLLGSGTVPATSYLHYKTSEILDGSTSKNISDTFTAQTLNVTNTGTILNIAGTNTISPNNSVDSKIGSFLSPFNYIYSNYIRSNSITPLQGNADIGASNSKFDNIYVTTVNATTLKGSLQYTLTFNDSNSGDSSSINYNNNASKTISANTLGAISKNVVTAKGDILYASGNKAVTKLAIGSAGKLLRATASNIPEWSNSLPVPYIGGTYPTADNSDGLQIVVLTQSQEIGVSKKAGYLYIITED